MIYKQDQIWEALEAVAIPNPTGKLAHAKANATAREVANTRDRLMRFLDEIEGDMSVAEVREALENYGTA